MSDPTVPANPFAPEKLTQALKPLTDLPKEQGGVGVVATQSGDLGVEGAIDKSLGDKGVYVQAQGSWMQQQGWKIAGWFGWRKR